MLYTEYTESVKFTCCFVQPCKGGFIMGIFFSVRQTPCLIRKGDILENELLVSVEHYKEPVTLTLDGAVLWQGIPAEGEFAVYIPEHEPHVGQAWFSNSSTSSAVIFPAVYAPTASNILERLVFCPFT